MVRPYPLGVQRVVVTRGNLTHEQMIQVCGPLVIEGQGFEFDDPPLVWNNNAAPFDAKVFGRFLHPPKFIKDGRWIYTQDDDCIVPNWKDIFNLWKPGAIVCNMPEDFQKAYASRRSRLLGFGSLFEASIIRPTFDRYFKHFPMDDLFLMEADRIFTGLNTERCIMVDVGHENMPYASDADRMWKQPDHRSRFEKAERRISEVLKAEAA